MNPKSRHDQRPGGQASRGVGPNRFDFSAGLKEAGSMTQPLALVWYERLLPGSRLVNRLQDLGYRVLVAPSPDALVSCAEQEKPLLVVVDLAATRGEVAGAISRLKQSPATGHLPVIAFADDREAALQESARKAGANLVVNEVAVLAHLEQFLDQALQLD
jgi:CheY-like chemotaxis protein